MSYPTIKLKEISFIKTGKLDANAAKADGEFPFFTCDPNTLRIDKWAYDTEAVLLAGNNASGNYTAKYYNGKFNAYQRVYIIESSNKQQLNTRYLCYVLNQQLRLLKTISSGSTTKFLTLGMLHGLDIFLPKIEVQNHIVSFLTAYDDLIENNQRQIKLLEEAAQRLYKEWFVDLRFPGYENAKIVDGVPEGWRNREFCDIVSIMSGGTPKTDKKEYYNGCIPFYTPKDSDGSFFAFDTITHISQLGLENCNSQYYPAGTVIITARGTVGKTTILAVPMAMNQSCYALKCDDLKCPYYLFFALNREVEKLKTMANGGVFNTIIVRTFDQINLMVPLDDVLKSFALLITPVMEEIKSRMEQNHLLKEARDRLLPKLMNGELEV